MADGEARKAKLEAISPAKHAHLATAPVLLIHGDDDTVVPIDQSRTMEQALRRAGKSVELIRLKGEDHGLSIASTRIQTLEQMDRFIQQQIPVGE